MKVSNIVVSTVAALSMASVLGIAYAQSSYSDPQTGATNQGTSGTMNQQDATGTTTQGSSTTPEGSTNMDSTSTSRSQPMYNERVARADRN
ncbi:MAG: hypothetical protein A2580_07850 [Hydrogenophilales bacterium RIFOXYD1_FULL_62_11]|nr:MAG: hypothetical protein A2580_07850 [Hydrogenophilales bacterium RIFOXYD1_FULL_62_11]